MGAQLDPFRNLNYLSVQLGAKSNKNVVQKKGQHITYILTRPCMMFFRFFRSKNVFLSLHAWKGEPSLLKVLSIWIQLAK